MASEKLRMIHLERIAPGRMPGGVWIRLCTRDRLLTEYGLTDPEEASAVALLD